MLRIASMSCASRRQASSSAWRSSRRFPANSRSIEGADHAIKVLLLEILRSDRFLNGESPRGDANNSGCEFRIRNYKFCSFWLAALQYGVDGCQECIGDGNVASIGRHRRPDASSRRYDPRSCRGSRRNLGTVSSQDRARYGQPSYLTSLRLPRL
jgi:hypothetical protein